MPTVKYAIHPGGPVRVVLDWGGFWEDLRVILDGRELGRIPSRKDLLAGREFTLSDGSVLSVRLDARPFKEDLLVQRDGQPLAGPPPTGDRSKVRNAGIALLLLAGMSIALSVMLVSTGSEVLRNAGVGLYTLGFGVTLFVLGLFVLRRSLGALIAALSIFTLDTLLGLLGPLVGEAFPSVGSLLVRAAVLYLLIQALGAIPALRRAEVAPPPVVYPLPPGVALTPESPPLVQDPENPYQR